MTTFLFVFLVGYLSSTLLTPQASWLAHKIGALDKPGGRKVHEKITPRLGGLAVFVGFLLALGTAMAVSPIVRRAAPESFLGVLLGSLVLLAIGIYDDARGAKASTKFPFQFLAAHIAYSYGVKFHLLSNFLDSGSYQLSEGVSYVFTLLWLVGVTNAMNFIDGLDALASGLAFIVSTTLLFVSIELDQVFYAAVYASLMGAIFGFGQFNKYPATIFLGDTGSTFLGFCLASTAVLGNQKITTLGGLVIPIVVLGLPVMDTLYAIVRRMQGGGSPFEPDRGHIHHRLLEKGYTPREAVWVIYLLAISLGVLVFFLVHAQNDQAALIITLLTASSFTLGRKLELLHRRTPPSSSGEEEDLPPEDPEASLAEGEGVTPVEAEADEASSAKSPAASS